MDENPTTGSRGAPATGRALTLAEVAALTTLLLTYIWLWQDAFPGASIVVTALYFGIGLLRHWRRGESPRAIGLRLDNLRPAARNALLLVVPVWVVVLATGAAQETWHFASPGRSAASLVGLTVWGTAQQYGLLCIFYRGLRELLGHSAAAGTTAVLFAIFHLPNPFLTLVTLVAGVAACELYRREPNLLAIGAAHAAISFVLYGALPLEVTGGLRVGPGYFDR